MTGNVPYPPQILIMLLNYETHADAYITEELQHVALYSPFELLDFDIHESPVMTREKQNSHNNVPQLARGMAGN